MDFQISWLSVADWVLTSHVIFKVRLGAHLPKQIAQPPCSDTLLIYLCFIWETLVPFQSYTKVYIDEFYKYRIFHVQPVFAINDSTH